MTIEQIIARLVGRDSEESPPLLLSAADSAALSQRLRTVVDGERSSAPDCPADRGFAADALALARYLDGTMDAGERSAFEAELVNSPARREELLAAVAWIDDIDAARAAPPAELTACAIALEPLAPVARPAAAGGGLVGFIERLLPRPRLAVVTSALASIAIVAVGLDIAIHTSPALRQAMDLPGPSSTGPAYPSGHIGRDSSTRDPVPNAPPERPFLPSPPRLGDPILLTTEMVNAMLAFRDEPTPAHRQVLLAALTRAGGPALTAAQVHSLVLQPQLLDQVRQRNGPLPTQISARVSVDGVLTIMTVK